MFFSMFIAKYIMHVKGCQIGAPPPYHGSGEPVEVSSILDSWYFGAGRNGVGSGTEKLAASAGPSSETLTLP